MRKLPDYLVHERTASFAFEHPALEPHHPDLWPAVDAIGEFTGAAGDLVYIETPDGMWRPAVVVKVGPFRVQVAYSFPGLGDRPVRRSVRFHDALVLTARTAPEREAPAVNRTAIDHGEYAALLSIAHNAAVLLADTGARTPVPGDRVALAVPAEALRHLETATHGLRARWLAEDRAGAQA